MIELATAIAVLSGADSSVIGARAEAPIILKVAADYHLTDEQTKVLIALRCVENGARGRELGVGSGDWDHPAQRYAHNGTAEMSVELQARWAAGTIAKRWNGHLPSFMRTWNFPDWVNETKNMESVLRRF